MTEPAAPDDGTDDVLAASRALWRRNWPAGIPWEPSYPFGEIPFGDTLRRWAPRGSPARRR